MQIQRATYQQAKQANEFDPFIGDRRIDHWRGELLVCVDRDEVLGFVGCSSNLFYNRPFIHALCVREAHRRKGIATGLVSRILEIYEGIDVWTSTETANAPAIAMFERAGFARKGVIADLDAPGSQEVFFARFAERR